MARKKYLILASASPRRSHILKEMNLKFEIVPSPYEEHLDNHDFSYEKIETLAKNKALGVLPFVEKPSLILAADTVVVINNCILGKPKDREEAFSMLKTLSGKEHFVVTASCLLDTKSGKSKTISTTSYVEFNNLTDKMIENYIETCNPFDKAGSYGIQELPSGFVKNLKGSLENVIGLSPEAISQLLQTKF